MNWNNNPIIQRAPGTVFRIVDGEAIVVHTQRATMAVLNETGQWIWSLLDTPLRANEIVERIAAEYEGPLAEIQADAREFLEDLKTKELIQVDDDVAS